MYDEHFGLSGRPFQLTPDPAFWYETATHRRAMAYLGYGLAQGEGFIVITGDIGAGKTTLVGHLLDTIDRAALNPVKIVSTAIEASDLLRIVAGQLDVDPAGLSKADLLVAIERGLHAVARTGRRTLLIVDEAQALPVDSLEELRMLSNFQAGGHALLQIVLLGQPEFRERLHGSARLEQLRQRVIAIHHLDPMEPDEVAPYIAHRLSVVGWAGRPDFVDSAFTALHRYTDGVPRRLNQLANRVMLHAAIERVSLIDAGIVAVVADDLHADLPTLALAPTEERHEAAAPEVAEAPVDEASAEMEIDHPLPASKPDVVAADLIEPEHALPEPTPAVAAAVPADPLAEPEPDVPDEAEPVEAETTEDPIAPSPILLRPRAWMTAPVAHDVPAEPVTAPEPAPAVDEDATPAELPADAMAARLAALEARIDEQDAALRRVLTLLVDWVEGDAATPARAAPDGYAPIRGAAA